MNAKEIAERLVPENISYEEIKRASAFRQTLHLRIFNNQLYVISGLKGEQRHAEILTQLFELIDAGYDLPNTEFKYYTMDTVYREDVRYDSAVFTFWDDEKNDNLSRRILAPSCWFSGMNSGKFMDNSPYEDYQDHMDRIVSFTEAKTMPFSEKENALIFKGQVSLYPHRVSIFEEMKDKVSSVSEFLVHERGRRVIKEGNTQYQNPIENLGKFRYQLVTNGATSASNGRSRVSGSCRSKYMLATGSIVIYITLGQARKEWWQHAADIDGVIQYCDSVDDAIETIRRLEANPDEADGLSKKGLNFVKEFLHKKNVMEYWYHLLTTYSERCDFEIREAAGQIIESQDHAWRMSQ